MEACGYFFLQSHPGSQPLGHLAQSSQTHVLQWHLELDAELPVGPHATAQQAREASRQRQTKIFMRIPRVKAGERGSGSRRRLGREQFNGPLGVFFQLGDSGVSLFKLQAQALVSRSLTSFAEGGVICLLQQEQRNAGKHGELEDIGPEVDCELVHCYPFGFARDFRGVYFRFGLAGGVSAAGVGASAGGAAAFASGTASGGLGAASGGVAGAGVWGTGSCAAGVGVVSSAMVVDLSRCQGVRNQESGALTCQPVVCLAPFL